MKLLHFPALLAAILLTSGCTTVRQARAPETIPTTGKAERVRDEHSLDYSVAIRIAAPPEVIWDILVDAPAYTTWNSTIVKLEGPIAPGSTLQLVTKDAPDRTFKLKVTSFERPKRMVWEDGGSTFLGVRNFTITPGSDGTTVFVMSETLSGGMLGMIEKKLPDFTRSFEAFAADLKRTAESRASSGTP